LSRLDQRGAAAEAGLELSAGSHLDGLQRVHDDPAGGDDHRRQAGRSILEEVAMKKLAWLALASAMAFGCAQENAPRSYVQPNVIKKADLQGTWYYLQTVTDAPPTSAIMFTGQSSELMKIRFDVQVNTLFARRAYEQ